ncbi:MAG: hypothetical protein ABSC95_00950 [Acetobacteraceae bacterium]|jgi:hypothetical protein
MRIAPDDRRAWSTALLLLCAVLVAPLLLVDVPPLLDYPNHLARMVVLAWPHDPALSRFATPRWAIIPDLGIDLVLPPLLHVLPVHMAGRVVVAGIVLLPVLGAIAYSRAVFGKRSWWALAAGLVAYNETVLLGFLNFTAGCGLALLLAAVWIRWRDAKPGRIAVLTTLGATVVFFCHIMGVVFLAVLLSAFEVVQVWRSDPPMLRHAVRRVAVLTVVFLPSAALYAISPLSQVGGETEFLSPHDKALLLLAPFVNYGFALDSITAAAVALFLVSALLMRRCRVEAGSGIAMAASLLLFAVAPAAAEGGQNIDVRFVIMCTLLLFAGILPQRLPRAMAVAAVAGFAGLFVARMTVLAMAWHASAIDIAELRAVIAPVMPGTAVFITSVTPAEAPQYWRDAPTWRRLSNGQREDIHMPALVMVDRHAFWPFLFDNASGQPIEKRPIYRALGDGVGPMPDHLAFATPDAVDLCGFDYVLLLDAGGAQDVAHFDADRLTLLTHSEFAALYRVRPQPRKCGGT